MRMKIITEDRSLRDAANEFLAFKRAQKLRERTLKDYKKYIDAFVEDSSNTLDANVLKSEIIAYFANIQTTSPSRYNHPYQYLHALFAWCAKQEYILYNPFEKLELKKVKDDGHVLPATIGEIQSMLKCLDKHNYTELRDYNIILLMLDTGIRTSELMALKNGDYDPEASSIFIRQEVAKTSRSRTIFLSGMTNTSLKKFLRVKPQQWQDWLFPTRDGLQLKANVLGRNFRKYCERAGTKFTPYQLRHSFATFYLQNGGDLFTLQKQMGHADLTMTRRYTEVSDEQVYKSHSAYSPIAMLNNSARRGKI